jgi:hypothetical protein
MQVVVPSVSWAATPQGRAGMGRSGTSSACACVFAAPCIGFGGVGCAAVGLSWLEAPCGNPPPGRLRAGAAPVVAPPSPPIIPPVVVVVGRISGALARDPPPPVAFKAGLPVPAAPLPAGRPEPGDPPPTVPAAGPPPTDPVGAPPPTAALPMPAAPTPPPTPPPPCPPPPANAYPNGSPATIMAKAKHLGLQIIMARSCSIDTKKVARVAKPNGCRANPSPRPHFLQANASKRRRQCKVPLADVQKARANPPRAGPETQSAGRPGRRQ